MPLHDRTTWLHGDRFHCLQPPTALGRTWRLVLLGPPGVGKGTQANLLSAVLGACPLSTGEIFRAAKERAMSSDMLFALDRMKRGDLVSDDIVLQLVQHRKTCLRCNAGFLLDGFPRTTVQAAALDGLLASLHQKLDAVIAYELGLTQLVERLAGRRVCRHCEEPYHIVTRPPKSPDVCDHCGGPVTQQEDDKPEPVRHRLKAYFEATAQVTDYYRRQDLLLTVSANASPETIFAATLELLVKRGFEVPCAVAR